MVAHRWTRPMCPMCPMKWIGFTVELSGGTARTKTGGTASSFWNCLRATLLAVDAVDARGRRGRRGLVTDGGSHPRRGSGGRSFRCGPCTARRGVEVIPEPPGIAGGIGSADGVEPYGTGLNRARTSRPRVVASAATRPGAIRARPAVTSGPRVESASPASSRLAGEGRRAGLPYLVPPAAGGRAGAGTGRPAVDQRWPAVTGSSTPVMRAAPGPAKNSTAAAMSSGVTWLRSAAVFASR